MGKRKQNKRESFAKRMRQELEDQKEAHIEAPNGSNIASQLTSDFRIVPKDRIEDKVDLIIKDAENNSQGSLTIWGSGLGIEKTIAVVEAIKRNYDKGGKRYQQDTIIKSDASNQQPHLQVILKLINDNVS